MIGILLCVVGILVAADAKGLLIGEAARPEERERLRAAILAHEKVEDLLDLKKMYVGPRAMVVAGRLDLRDDLSAGEVERLTSQIERELHEVVPDVQHVFLAAAPPRDRADLRATPIGERRRSYGSR